MRVCHVIWAFGNASQLLPQVQLALSPLSFLGLLLVGLLLPFFHRLLFLLLLVDLAAFTFAFPAPLASGSVTHALTLRSLAFARVLFLAGGTAIGDRSSGGGFSPPSVRRAVDYAYQNAHAPRTASLPETASCSVRI